MYWAARVRASRRPVAFQLRFWDCGDGALKKFEHLLPVSRGGRQYGPGGHTPLGHPLMVAVPPPPTPPVLQGGSRRRPLPLLLHRPLVLRGAAGPREPGRRPRRRKPRQGGRGHQVSFRGGPVSPPAGLRPCFPPRGGWVGRGRARLVTPMGLRLARVCGGAGRMRRVWGGVWGDVGVSLEHVRRPPPPIFRTPQSLGGLRTHTHRYADGFAASSCFGGLRGGFLGVSVSPLTTCPPSTPPPPDLTCPRRRT